MTRNKVIGWAVVIFAAWFIITDPQGAAGATAGLVNALKGVGNSLAVFFASL